MYKLDMFNRATPITQVRTNICSGSFWLDYKHVRSSYTFQGTRQQFLMYFHDNPLGGHLGRLKTLLKILEVAYWPDVRKDVGEYIKSCITCQRYKPQLTKLSGYLQSTPVQEPGNMLGVDIMGPFPKSRNQNQYLLVVVDYHSK